MAVTAELEQTVRRYYELVDAGELEQLYGLFHDNVVYQRPGYDPIVGLDAFKAFYAGTRVIRHGRHTIRTIAADGPCVIVEGDFEGMLRDGSPTTCRYADVWRFQDHKVMERTTYFFAPLI